MNLEDLIRTRRSIRSFKKEVPPQVLIEKLVQAAGMAPSASNKQGWRFLVVQNSEAIQKLAALVEEKTFLIQKNLTGVYLEKFESYGKYFIRFQEAPVVIVPIYKNLLILSDLLKDSEVEEMEEVSGLLSVSLAIENLLLMAHDQGLGCSCLTGPLIAQNNMKEYLKIPLQWKIACLIALGYPEEEPEATSRKDLKHIIQWIK